MRCVAGLESFHAAPQLQHVNMKTSFKIAFLLLVQRASNASDKIISSYASMQLHLIAFTMFVA